jgi:hypothetical protein
VIKEKGNEWAINWTWTSDRYGDFLEITPEDYPEYFV